MRNAAIVVSAILVLVCTLGLGYGLFFLLPAVTQKGMLVESLLAGSAAVMAYLVICLPAFVMLQLARNVAADETLDMVGRVVNSVFQSGAFYFFVGIAFLATAFLGQRAEINSSLTFIVALLGIAILLYGTGSQATLGMGQGSQALDPDKIGLFLKDKLKEPDKSPEISSDLIKIASQPASSSAYVNFAVAGGAAALTAFFGWGITSRSEAIQNVFRDHTRYDLVRIDTKPTYDITPFKIEARLEDGRSIYMRTFGNTLFVTVPELVTKRKPRLMIYFTKTTLPNPSRPSANLAAERQSGNTATEEPIRKVLKLDNTIGSECTVTADYQANQQINDSGSIDAPIKEWTCSFSMENDRPKETLVNGVAVTIQ